MSEKCFVDIHYSHVFARSNSKELLNIDVYWHEKREWRMIYHWTDQYALRTVVSSPVLVWVYFFS